MHRHPLAAIHSARTLLLAIAVVALASACGGTSSAELDPAVLSDDVAFIDVRTDAEVARGMIAGAIHIPIDELPDRLDEVRAIGDRPIVVYCQSGVRSARATDLLREEGFEGVMDGGGIGDVAALGAEVTSP